MIFRRLRTKDGVSPVFLKRSPKILLIEDDIDLCAILKDILEGCGYECRIHQDAIKMQNILDSFLPDLILIDYLLPGSNGGELCLNIKSNHTTSDIPVVIISAFPDYMLPLGFYRCDAFLQKPFSTRKLLRNIDLLLFSPSKKSTTSKN